MCTTVLLDNVTTRVTTWITNHLHVLNVTSCLPMLTTRLSIGVVTQAGDLVNVVPTAKPQVSDT